MKIFIYPPNSLILADLVERSGHEPLVLQTEIKKLVRNPDIDSPPMNITDDQLKTGLKFVTVETPSGIRGRLGLIGPLIEQAEAAIIIENAHYSFGCIGCYQSSKYIIHLVVQKNIPTLNIQYPTTVEEAEKMVSRIRKFFKNLARLGKKPLSEFFKE